MLRFLENFIINSEYFSMVNHIKSNFLRILHKFFISKGTKFHYLKKLENILKSTPTKEIKVKRKRKTAAIHTNITFNHDFSQHVQI